MSENNEGKGVEMTEVRKILIEVNGCKTEGCDCNFKSCKNWGSCKNMEAEITAHLTALTAEHDRVKAKLMDDIILLQNKFLEAKAEKAELEKKVIEVIPKGEFLQGRNIRK